MSDAPTENIEPPAQAAAVPDTPPVAEVQAAAPAPVEAAPAPDPIAADPLLRAEVEKRKAEEVAKLRHEAKLSQETERAALEAKLRKESDERQETEKIEAERLSTLSREQALEEKIAELARADAERDAKLELAQAASKAAGETLEFVRAVTNAGKRLASTDAGLEDLAMSKAQALVAGGKTMAEAITAMSEDKGMAYLFAQPTALSSAETSTAAGSSAPRGSTTPASPPAADEVDAWSMTSEQFNAYESSGGYMDLVTEVARPRP